jgi:uncharacterized peroxidase-related enzyme
MILSSFSACARQCATYDREINLPKFPSLGDKANVPEILKLSPAAGVALIEMHEPLMRGPSPLSEGERELIATYVSGLNECQYCYGVHSETAKAYDDIPSDAVDKMMTDLDSAGLPENMIPILKFARKLTEKPSSVTDDDAKAVFDAGWSEKALHDAIMVTCCFNFMNRLLEGHGVHGNAKMYAERGPMLKKYGYLPLVRLISPKVT